MDRKETNKLTREIKKTLSKGCRCDVVPCPFNNIRCGLYNNISRYINGLTSIFILPPSGHLNCEELLNYYLERLPKEVEELE